MKTPLSRRIRQHKFSTYYYSIIFNWISWFLNENNQNFCKDDPLLGTFGEVSGRHAIEHVRLKKPSREKFCKLWQIYRSVWKGQGIDYYKHMKYLENSDFAIYLLGFNFEDRFSEKKDSYLVLISEKHWRRSFFRVFF